MGRLLAYDIGSIPVAALTSRFLYEASLMLDLVMDAIIGTKQNRYGCRPSPANTDYLRSVVKQCIIQERPIKVLTGWGAHKGYNQGPYGVPDLIDAMAIQRLAKLHEAVSVYHSPGVEIDIFMEDYTRHMMTGKEYREYGDNLHQLIRAYGINYIFTVNESNYITDPNYGNIIINNAKAIFAGNAAKIGWQGEIDWDYYIARAATENPDMDESNRRELVSIFLGSILARVQHKIVPHHDMKVSFVPYPKSLPDALRRGRLEYKIKEDKHSKLTTAPWTCFGVTGDGDDWTTATVREVRSKRFRCVDSLVNGLTVPALREG